MSIIVTFIQICGLLIPSLGIIGLLAKEQIKMSFYLLLTSIGGLIMNSCYMLTAYAEENQSAYMISKVAYVGNAIFYIFFVLFIMSYLNLRFTKLMIVPLVLTDIAVIFSLFSRRREDLVFSEFEIEKQAETGMMSPQYKMGILQNSRYGYLSALMLVLLVITIIKVIRTKRSLIRLNLLLTAIAEFIITSAMVVDLISSFEFNLVPILSSISILGIIIGVLKGSFLNAIESGRSWFVESMEGALVIVDNLYLYQDSNSYAKRIFPELKKMQQGTPLPEMIMSLFDRCELKTGETTAHKRSLKSFFDEKKIIVGCCDEDKKKDVDEVSDIITHEDHIYNRVVNTISQNRRTIGYVLLMTDITEQRNMLEELEKAKEDAEKANESKSIFMSNMSHEIRTPMNAIVGMTEILLREDLPERDTEYLMNIKNSGDSLLSIINDILDFSKIEAGKLDIIEAVYEPMSMFNDLSMIFLNRIGKKLIELVYDIDPKLPARLNGDAKRIRQIIINIMNNAIKFTDEGHVGLKLTVEGAGKNRISMQFDIEDTGQGIKEEDINKLFGAYSQVDTKKNHEKEGTGLGLSICRQLVNLMGGTIWVNSEYGKGSTFSFKIEQEVVNDQPAAAIKEQYADKPVWGCFKNEYLISAFEENSQRYKLQYHLFKDMDELKKAADNLEDDGLPSCLFADEDSIPDKDTEKILHDRNTNICILYNPMTEEMPSVHATIVNKPLYALNFCQCINRERIAGSVSQKRKSFTAKTARILIADDNEMNLKVAKGLLEPFRMDIVTAENGKEAVDKVRNDDFDIVFMDHMMPVMDGVEATAAIRGMGEEKYRNLPIIALSANATSQAQELFKESGFDDFVAKPIMMKEISSALEKWLPKEKIEYTDNVLGSDTVENDPSNGNGTSDSTAAEDDIRLAPIAGADKSIIDIHSGIECCGTKELYISLLSDYYKLIDKKRKKIEKCLNDGMIKDVTIEVHALKNTSRMIGASGLSDEFYELEKIGNSDISDEEKLEKLKTEIPDVLEHFSSYKKILAAYAANDVNDGREASNDELIMIVTTLKDAMENFELDMVDDALKELQGCRLPERIYEKVQELDDLVADVAMEDVIRVAEEIIVILSGSVSLDGEVTNGRE